MVSENLQEFEYLHGNISRVLNSANADCLTGGERSFDVNWTDEHLKRINEIQLALFKNIKDPYFCKWFQQSRVKKIFSTLKKDMTAQAEREDNV